MNTAALKDSVIPLLRILSVEIIEVCSGSQQESKLLIEGEMEENGAPKW